MEVDGINLAVGGGAVTAIAGVVGAWIKAKFGRTKVEPDPLNVRKEDKFVTRGEFNRHVDQDESAHNEMFRRLVETEQTTARQDGKLDEIGSDVKTIKDLLIGKALKK